ncbi:3'(2'),5'-bisphosphate nucleotidase CysQ [Lichenihabitans sp. Uapishka_5]|uniref:3'(2'),5'-bisphosphate nucleotidase CysQ n=1 Tax=Lichenihabitans sp. Uapishka_5 TaxID=3037302 RepID=UPI0029E7EF7E|nr:3'(2'),5'-bisphosphate nucleotidase CysQ [Lichenihabitans sp. Uapishka_5]MDX7953689.1 3'(2'),5'-bisphosphate nucleotidase CysQ [Lichenihabitans sp. Uapishka_5]
MSETDIHDLNAVSALLEEAARDAGDTIAMKYFREGGHTVAQVHNKLGGSPVTEADLAVDRFLHKRLLGALPRAGWLSEETADSPERLNRHDVLVVDPIDGTRAFVAGLTSWAVSVALVSGERPVAGVVYVPATGQLYSAVKGGGAKRDGTALQASDTAALAGASVAGPQTFVGAFAARGHMTFVEKVPSLACRFVRVADATFDIGMSSANAHDWDMAAADLILEEAGGVLTDGTGAKLAYNKAVPRHPPLFGSGRALHPALLELVQAMPRGRG